MITASRSVTCSNCNRMLHKTCANMAKANAKELDEWKCTECTSVDVAIGDNTENASCSSGMAELTPRPIKRVAVNSPIIEVSPDKTLDSSIVYELRHLRQEISEMKTFLRDGLTKCFDRLDSLELRIKTIEDKSTGAPTPHGTNISTTTATECYETMVAEIQERSVRMKNVIICGIKETNNNNSSDRVKYDMCEVTKIIKLADQNLGEPLKCYRLGKYDASKNRPIKIILPSADSAQTVLRNSNRISNQFPNVKCFSDQTPQQKKYLYDLRDELKRRTDNGEGDLTIKYVRGTPKIVELLPKN